MDTLRVKHSAVLDLVTTLLGETGWRSVGGKDKNRQVFFVALKKACFR